MKLAKRLWAFCEAGGHEYRTQSRERNQKFNKGI
jgi:hypothetical protein